MRFRYLGDKEDMTAFGYDFSNGAFPDITEQHAIAKLSGNRFFEAVGDAPFDEDPISNAPAKKKGGRPRKVQPTEA